MARRAYKPRKGIFRAKKRYSIRARLNAKRNIFRRRRRFQRIHRTIGGFPNSKTVALRYVDNVILNPTSSASAVNVYRINSVFDPDYTGVGHQPMFHDNYASVYQKYRVNYATITFVALDNHVINTSTSDQTSGTTTQHTNYYANNERACRMFILKDDEINDYPSSLDTLIEEGNKNLAWRYVPNNASASMQRLSMKAYPKYLLKCPYNDVGLSADCTASPDKQCYFVCGVASFPNGYDSDGMSFQVIITYNVTYFDLKKNQTQN